MARHKRQKAAAAEPSRKPKDKPFFRPFEGLARQLKSVEAAPATPKARRPPAVTPTVDDDQIFAAAMAGVQPLPAPDRKRAPALPAEPPEPRTIDDDTAALLELSEFVAGHGPFDIVDSDEHIEGAATGLDPRILRRLRKGEYSVASHLDLHGLTRDEARAELERFVGAARRRGQRCVLVVHGRGLHSKDQRPVLKEALVAWFGRASLRKQILAFCSARPYDGGTGALYVLLRR